MPPLALVSPEPLMVPPVQVVMPLIDRSPLPASVPAESVSAPVSPLAFRLKVPLLTHVVPVTL